MATPTIPNGEEHFFNILYEGNGAGQRVGKFVPFTDNGTIPNSLIFNRADNATMTRTPSSAGTRTKFTVSVWVKLGSNFGTRRFIFYAAASGNNFSGIEISSNNRFRMYASDGSGSIDLDLEATRTLEDTSKWYHLLAVFDSTQSTASDRAKMYIDGDQVTTFSTSTFNLVQDFEFQGTNNVLNVVGGWDSSLGGSPATYAFDGYMAEMNMVDGSALTPASFGVTDTSTGRWIPAQVKPHPTTTTTYTVTVVSGNPSDHPYYNVGSTNKFAINGSTATADVDLTLYEGATYRFDQSDSSNSGHPLRFSTVAHGTHASGGTEYTTNVTTVGTPGTSGAYTEITVASSAPDLHYYCSSHNGMGYQASTPNGYGANGFRLTFSDSSSLGADTSGNSSTFTATNLATTDQTTDSPTQNHATINPNTASNGSITFAEGNLNVEMNNAYPGNVLGTLGASSGKYYWEVTISGTGSSANGYATGVAVAEWSKLNSDPGSTASPFSSYIDSRSLFFHNGSSVSNSTSFTAGDVIGIALNLDDSEISYFKNNTIVGSAQPLVDGQTYFPFFKNSTSVADLRYTPNFGQKSWNYTPPTGFVALQQDNLPETAKGIVGLTWIKDRDNAYSHGLRDSSRGRHKDIFSNLTQAEVTNTDGVQKFLKGGIQIEDLTGLNASGASIVSWNWVANGGTTASNSNGSITSTVQANQTAGFSIVQYTGTGSAGTVGHGLSSAPEWILFKNLDNGSEGWSTYHTSLTSAAYILTLNNTNAQASSATDFNSTAPTSTVFSVGTNARTNNSSQRIVAYCWHGVDGFSKFGKYTGNGSTDGAFVYTGFKPAWLMVKNRDGTLNWVLWDNKRTPINPIGTALLPNGTNADTTGFDIDFLSNGFKLRDSETTLNGSGNTIIYMAFAEHPFVGDGTSPATAR
jgi:hypothetical protein